MKLKMILKLFVNLGKNRTKKFLGAGDLPLSIEAEAH